MTIEIKKVGDITEIYAKSGNAPKRITLDLSDDQSFYHTRLYYDFYGKSTDKVYPGYIECRSKFPQSFVHEFNVVPMVDDKDTIFTLTMPDEEAT